MLGLEKGVAEFLIIRQRFELLQLIEVRDPAIPDGFGDNAGQRRV